MTAVFRVSFFKALPCFIGKVFEIVGPVFFRDCDSRHFVLVVHKVKAAFFGNLDRVVKGFLDVREKGSHLLFCLQGIVAFINKPVFIRDCFLRLKTQKPFVCFGIFGIYIVGVVTAYELDAHLFSEVFERIGNAALFLHSVIHDLQIKIITEQILVAFDVFPRRFKVAS